VTIAAVVEGQRVNPGGAELTGHRLPCLTIAVAHVQQQHAGSGLAGRVIGGLELGAVRGGDVHIPRGGRRGSKDGKTNQEQKQGSEKARHCGTSCDEPDYSFPKGMASATPYPLRKEAGFSC